MDASPRFPSSAARTFAAGAVLVKIDNPETLAKNEQALAAKIVAEAQLANVKVGTRVEVIAARKAELERAQASVVLAQKTYDRVSQLAEHGNAPIARLDQTTDALHESQRNVDQAKSAYEQAINGYTKEEHEIAAAAVKKAIADIAAVQSIIEQMVIYAPVASQVYRGFRCARSDKRSARAHCCSGWRPAGAVAAVFLGRDRCLRRYCASGRARRGRRFCRFQPGT